MSKNKDKMSEIEGPKRFELLDEATKDDLLQKRKALNTNRATKKWVQCLNDYLKEQKLGDIETISSDQLPEIIGDFYFSARKKRISEDSTLPIEKARLSHYKNSSLK